MSTDNISAIITGVTVMRISSNMLCRMLSEKPLQKVMCREVYKYTF